MDITQSTQESQELDAAQPTPEHLPLPQVTKIFPKHLAEWVEGSGVPEAIVRLAVRSLNDRTVIAQRINWKKYLDKHALGWWVSSVDLSTMQLSDVGQFKPDKPVMMSPEDEDGSKYLTRKDKPYDAIALPHPDKNFWQRVIDDPSHPVELIEGPKKAGCLVGLDYVALALCGVTMGLQKGGKNLVKNLEILAVEGRPIRIVFDADLATNPDIRRALKALATVLKKKGCVVSVVIIPVELESKGMDDVWANHGPEKVKEIMDNAVPYSEWLKSLENQINSIVETPDTGNKKSKKPPTPRQTAAELDEEYRQQWKYHESQQTWRAWTGKCWEKKGLGEFKSLIVRTLDAKGINYNGIEYINNVVEMLKCYLRQTEWQMWDRKRYINFNNCVLDGHSLKILPHSPGMGFTFHLPYDYKPLTGGLGDSLEALQVNCPKIYHFFYEAMKGDKRKMFKLLAIINALLKHRFFDLQMFVHLVGAPGSGKGKFARFCQKLVGKDNTTACQLEKLSDGSTKASVIDKQLVVFPDERKPVGIDSILSLTGGDEISYRELYQPAASAHFYGSLIICSNKPIFIGDTTGLERRLCLVGFDNPIATEKRDHSLEQELDSEIPACIAIALSLTDSAVTQTIQGKGANQIIEYKAKEWEMKVESDSIAGFFDMELIHDPTATTRTGELFNAYTAFCEEGGMSRIKLPKFGGMLADILTGENLPFTRKQGAQAYFVGLRLRTKTDTHPTHSEVLAGIEGVDQGVRGGYEGVDEGVERSPDIHLRGLRGFGTKVSRENANDDFSLDEEERDREVNLSLDEQESDQEINLPPSTPSTPSIVLPPRDITLSSTPCQTPTQPPSPETAAEQVPIAPSEPETAQEPPSTPSTGSSQPNLLLLQDYARRIGEALGYQSPATAKAIAEYIQESIVNQEITESESAEVAGIKNWQAFTALRNLTEDEQNLVEIVQQAIASNDAETAKSALSSLKEVCNSGAADRQKVWNSLAESERVAFKALVQ